jgi:HAL2 family 3'(2'),5'-bisphosphate nucleotidase
MIDRHNPEIKFCIQAVRSAAILVRYIQSTLISPAIEKDDRSPVTVADLASQALVGQQLERDFQDDLLVAEESSSAFEVHGAADILTQVTKFVRQFVPGAENQDIRRWIDFGAADSGTRFWTLDPIDGTKGFLRDDQYAVALALVKGGRVMVAGLGCPNLVNASKPVIGGLGSLVIAARSQGTWVTSLDEPSEYRRLRVSPEIHPQAARVLRSVESGHTNISQIDIFAERLGIRAEPVRMDSQAKYALLASGNGEYYLRLLSPKKPEYKEKIWDQAAGSLILEEAGGKITDLDGSTLDFTTGRQLVNNRGILGSNGLLHKPALEALKAIGA